MPVDLLQSEVEVPRFDIKYLCAGIRQGLSLYLWLALNSENCHPSAKTKIVCQHTQLNKSHLKKMKPF